MTSNALKGVNSSVLLCLCPAAICLDLQGLSMYRLVGGLVNAPSPSVGIGGSSGFSVFQCFCGLCSGTDCFNLSSEGVKEQLGWRGSFKQAFPALTVMGLSTIQARKHSFLTGQGPIFWLCIWSKIM